MASKRNKILVHVCCAACASFVTSELEKDGFNVSVLYYNPNFNHLEYHFRLTGVKRFCQMKDIELITPRYDELEYLNLISPYQDKRSIKHISDDERFARKAREVMINLVMRGAMKTAEQDDYNFITTSMLCSPYRDHNTVWDIGGKIADEQDAQFFYKDFRKGYWMGRNFARKNGLAIPAYCSDYME